MTQRLHITLPRLRPLQRELYDHMCRWNHWVCHRRFGKCLDVGTPIPLAAGGFKSLGDVVAGDVLFDERGMPTTVQVAHEIREDLSCYAVVFSDGETVICDADHLWYTETKLDRAARLRTNNMRQQHGMSGLHQRKAGSVKSTQAIAESLRYQGESNHSIPCALPVQYAGMPVVIPPYILGSWLGDGHNDNTYFTSMDGDIVARWAAYALDERLTFAPIGLQNAGQAITYGLKGRGGWFKHQLQTLGVHKNKHIPDSYLYGSVEDRLELLRGLMDTDGSVVPGTSHCEWSQKSYRFAQDMGQLLSSFGLKYTLAEKLIGGMSYYRLTFSATFCPFFCKRKASVFHAARWQSSRRYIRDVFPVAPRPVRCLQVDSPSHLFLCGRAMIPTHNTYLCLCILLKKAFDCPLTAPRYAYLAPLYRQVKAIAWDYLKRLLAQIPGCRHNEAELWGELPTGARIQLLGADNPDSLRGVYLDGAVLDEYPHMRQRTFTEVIRPALSDRLGWAIKVGTPYGKNHFYLEHRQALQAMDAGDPETHAALYRASETGVVSDAELASARATMGDNAYAQEYECVWEAPIPGAYYADEFHQADGERRITRVPYDPTYPVYTFWDIGYADSTAIWCAQFVGRQVCLIHYMEDSGHGLPYYATYLKNLPYEYRAHIFPHDGAHHEYGSGERIEETAARLLPGRIEVASRPSIETGIANVRLLFPRVVFDEQGCEIGLNALRAYHHKWDADKKVFLAYPEHNWASHGADSLRTLAVALPLVEQIEKEWAGVKVAPPVESDEPEYMLVGSLGNRGWLG